MEESDDDNNNNNDSNYSGGELLSSRSGGANRTPCCRPHGWRQVTEDDLRKMAQYVHKKCVLWTKLTMCGCWVKFAARPQVHPALSL